MGQCRAADQPVHLDGLGEAGRDIVGQLPKEPLEQNPFVDRHITHRRQPARMGRPFLSRLLRLAVRG